MTARADILNTIRAARMTGDGPEDPPPAAIVPARGQVTGDARLALFMKMAQAAAASLETLNTIKAVPDAVARYLLRGAAAKDSPSLKVKIAPNPVLMDLPWDRAPGLTIAAGPAAASDAVSLTCALAGIAETGTLALASGAQGPVTLNFLPTTHLVLLHTRDILGTYEELWTLLRRTFDGHLPRTINLVTGPSRSADIEQTILMGAHGPQHLHILLIAEPDAR